MRESYYWENGERVAAYDPREEVEEVDPIDSPPLVMMRKFLGVLKSSNNPSLTIECMCFLFGLGYEGLTASKIASRNNVTRSSFYNRLRIIGETLVVDPKRPIISKNQRLAKLFDNEPKTQEFDPIESQSFVLIRRFLGLLKASPHPSLTIDCLCFVSGVCYDGISMAEIARKNKVTRATVSNRVVELGETFGIAPTRAMRSRKARENCRKSRFEKIEELLS